MRLMLIALMLTAAPLAAQPSGLLPPCAAGNSAADVGGHAPAGSAASPDASAASTS